jgi:glycogen operon protein
MAIEGEQAPDIAWLNPDGKEMAADAWNKGYVRCLGVQLYGESIDVNARGEEISGDTLLLLFNADHGTAIPFTLPTLDENHAWELLLDSANIQADRQRLAAGVPYELKPCSVALLRDRSPEQDATSSRRRNGVR